MAYIGKRPQDTFPSNNSVTATIISANAVGSSEIAGNAVGTGEIAANAVTAAKLPDNVITATMIPNDLIDSEHYAAASIDNEHLADDAVDSDEIAAGAIDLAHMSANSIDSTQYVDGSIDLAHMSADSIDSTQYVDGSIDLAHMSSQSVDEDNLYISNSGSNGQFLSKQSGNSGGLTWAAAGADFDTAITINDSGADVDFRVESNNKTHMLFVDGGTDNVGIGTTPADAGSTTRLHIADAASTAILQLTGAGVGTGASDGFQVAADDNGELEEVFK